ncbi:MAG TPA: ATP-binding protein [Hyphomicrobiales bacterium]|nr:ATP-binding protein [Hyphomicrobiales bacterium]
MPQLLVTTGPESSGKTTLARALSQTLHAPLVEECSRDYLNRKLAEDAAWHYQEPDLLAIAQQQVAAEQEALRGIPSHVICDTDLMVIRLWSQEKYRRVAPDLERLITQSLAQPRLFLLCSPDMPWEPDPLRENPSDRWRLFDLYQRDLATLGLPHLILSGSHPERLQQVLDHLKPVNPSPA